MRLGSSLARLLLIALACVPMVQAQEVPASAPAEGWDDAALDRLIYGETLARPPEPDDLAPGPAEPRLAGLRLPAWIWDGHFEVGLGTASNPLFLDDHEPAAAFLSLSLEFSALRPTRDGRWSWLGYVVADQRLYLQSRGTFADETLALLYGRAWRSWGWLTTGLTVQSSYSDQAFGIAVSPVATETLGLSAFGILVQPELEARLPKGLFVRLNLPIERVYFEPSSDHYWEPAFYAAVGWQSRRTRIEASYRGGYRDYDNRPYRSIFGNPRPGTQLVWKTWRSELAWRQAWDHARTLRTTSRVRWRGVADNGVGFDDYEAWEFRQEVNWEIGPWALEVLAAYAEPRYRYQRPVVAIPVERAQQQVFGEIRISRELGRHWRVAASWSYDELRSNKAGEDFRNRVLSVRLARLFGTHKIDLETIRD